MLTIAMITIRFGKDSGKLSRNLILRRVGGRKRILAHRKCLTIALTRTANYAVLRWQPMMPGFRPGKRPQRREGMQGLLDARSQRCESVSSSQATTKRLPMKSIAIVGRCRGLAMSTLRRRDAAEAFRHRQARWPNHPAAGN